MAESIVFLCGCLVRIAWCWLVSGAAETLISNMNLRTRLARHPSRDLTVRFCQYPMLQSKFSNLIWI
jgi:hypothetical protein